MALVARHPHPEVPLWHHPNRKLLVCRLFTRTALLACYRRSPAHLAYGGLGIARSLYINEHSFALSLNDQILARDAPIPPDATVGTLTCI
eukprot:2231822-Amphidinium_carterae.1